MHLTTAHGQIRGCGGENCVIKELRCVFMIKDLNDKTFSATSQSEGVNLISTEMLWGLPWHGALPPVSKVIPLLPVGGTVGTGLSSAGIAHSLPQSVHPSQQTSEAAMLQVQPWELHTMHLRCITKDASQSLRATMLTRGR